MPPNHNNHQNKNEQAENYSYLFRGALAIITYSLNRQTYFVTIKI